MNDNTRFQLENTANIKEFIAAYVQICNRYQMCIWPEDPLVFLGVSPIKKEYIDCLQENLDSTVRLYSDED